MQNLQDDILGEYLSECQEMLERLSGQLVNLEKEHFDKSILRGFARDVHTIKGSSQLFGFKKIGLITHAMEECLERVQQTSRDSIPGLTDLLYEAIDQVSKIFHSVKTERVEPQEIPDLGGLLERLQSYGSIANSPSVESLVEIKDVVEPIENYAEPPLSNSSLENSSLEAEILSDIAQAETKPVMVVHNARQFADDPHGDTIRVNVELLDSLMGLVSELVLIRNEVNQVSKEKGGDDLIRIHQRLNAITSELQNNVMKTRMQPIGNLLGKFQRVVRDLSRDLGKAVGLELEGAETELDKGLLETVRDPLTHIIRNAIDHGIESPEERTKLGKSSQGSILIRAVHENGHVTIDVLDDGRGINHDRVRTKAFEKGLLTPDLLGKLTDQETLQLIFLPGFSTADKVSSLSGRGLGMDIVKTNVERIGGAVDIQTKAGHGTKVTLKIPLTLAIISALLIRTKGGRYAIPQVKLLELIKVDLSEISGYSLDHVVNSPVIRLRGSLLPLIDLNSVLLGKKNSDINGRDQINVVVVNADHRYYGLIVDEIEDSADIVVKPLPSIVKSLGVYTGASILADGSTCLILDVNGIASYLSGGIADESFGMDFARESHADKRAGHDSEMIEYLSIDIGSKTRCALPLCIVHRLEEFPADAVQYSGSNRVVKYRDSVLPLISLREILNFKEFSVNRIGAETAIRVVVVRRSDQLFGLQIDGMLDFFVSSEDIVPDFEEREGILGTIVHQGQVVIILDGLSIVAKVFPSQISGSGTPWRKSSRQIEHIKTREQHHILVVEDGNFLRKQIAQILKDAGFRVSVEINGQKALELIENSHTDPFTLLVSDIEMPVMDGFELVSRVRASKVAKALPAIALTSRFSQSDIDRGLKLGFTRYIEKMNAGQLVSEVDSVLGLNGGR